MDKLTPQELERLYLLMEECSEVIHAIGKVLRHGYTNTHPDSGITNKKRLEEEIAHVFVAYELLQDNNDIDKDNVEANTWKKAQTMKKYLYYKHI